MRRCLALHQHRYLALVRVGGGHNRQHRRLPAAVVVLLLVVRIVLVLLVLLLLMRILLLLLLLLVRLLLLLPMRQHRTTGGSRRHRAVHLWLHNGNRYLLLVLLLLHLLLLALDGALRFGHNALGPHANVQALLQPALLALASHVHVHLALLAELARVDGVLGDAAPEEACGHQTNRKNLLVER